MPPARMTCSMMIRFPREMLHRAATLPPYSFFIRIAKRNFAPGVVGADAPRFAGVPGGLHMTDAIIQAQHVEKYYAQSRDARIQVIAPTDLAIYPAEIVALLGP